MGQERTGHGPHSSSPYKAFTCGQSPEKWQCDCVGDLRTQIATAKEIIWRLDQAEEARPLSDDERSLRSQLKSSYLGLLAIQKMKLRQRSRLTWIRLGDANSKLFHSRANGRRRKVHIQTLSTASGAAITKEDKEEVLLTHFKGILGTKAARHVSLDWEGLHYPAHDLSELDVPFSEDEIKDAVFSLPSIKAPGPDGFIGAFFKSCWDIIHDDIAAAILHMANLRGGCANLINSANIILIPKKPDAATVSDYRPISLTHSLSKIFSKLLANRLAPVLPDIVSKCQSAFVKKRSIHDNFMHVQNLIKELHASKTPKGLLGCSASASDHSNKSKLSIEVDNALAVSEYSDGDWEYRPTLHLKAVKG
ncbi:hypothetical protein ACQ4PT_011637 [Festuca glaucescens]